MTPTYFLKVRRYPSATFVSVWLCARWGTKGESAVLWGEVIPELAEQLIEALKLPVERETSPLAGGLTPIQVPGCPPVAQQATLFGGEKESGPAVTSRRAQPGRPDRSETDRKGGGTPKRARR
jgi:hypothetical protein